MNLIEYLNQIYDTDDLHDYKYRKIQPDAADLVETDLKKLVLILDIVRLKENYEQTDNVFEQINSKILISMGKSKDSGGDGCSDSITTCI